MQISNGTHFSVHSNEIKLDKSAHCVCILTESVSDFADLMLNWMNSQRISNWKQITNSIFGNQCQAQITSLYFLL